MYVILQTVIFNFFTNTDTLLILYELSCLDDYTKRLCNDSFIYVYRTRIYKQVIHFKNIKDSYRYYSINIFYLYPYTFQCGSFSY